MALIKLYAQTGFDSVNIPDSIKTLEENFVPVRVYEDYNLIQSEYLAEIVVDNMTPMNARRIDYVTIESDEEVYDKSCYTVESYQMQAPDVCKFVLLLDAYNTLGGFAEDSGNLILSGSAERLSVSVEEDDTKFFPLEEPFAPSERSQNTFQTLLTLNEDPYLVIETITVPPKTVGSALPSSMQISGNINQNFEGASVGANAIQIGSGTDTTTVYTRMILPSGRRLIPSNYRIFKPDGTSILMSLGTRLWRHDKTAEEVDNPTRGIEYEITVDGKVVKGDLFKDMRDNGRDNDIIAYYEVPREYANLENAAKYKPNEDENYGGVRTGANKNTINNTTFSPKVVFNNKARYSQNCTVKVYSPVSGKEVNKQLYEICNPGTSPSGNMVGEYFITADIRAEGSPMFGWSYLNGVSQKGSLAEIITGGSWRNVPLGIEGMSNINLEQAKLDAQQAQEKREFNKQVVQAGFNAVGSTASGIGKIITGNIAGGIGDFIGGAGTIATTEMSGYNMSKAQQEQQQLLQHASIAASAQISVGNSNFARECGMNTFVMIISQYSDTDTSAYDTFLTKYGYNVGNKMITNLDFYTRPAFNYVKVNDITIESVTGSLNLINMVKEQLKLGVRIWHKKPNFLDMTAGGNR